ncbi:transposase [Actinoallomurus acaciae]|uniref:Transposase n=1 Tax=Actinoallomurus acaciae TaxID=502577 RepID=A0ABV5YMW1_9ACTN
MPSGGDTCGYDAGKKVNGRERLIITDPLGLLITVMVCAASVQDRDGAKSVLSARCLKAVAIVRARIASGLSRRFVRATVWRSWQGSG